MATVSSNSCTTEIGETAGVVWKQLSENGPMDLAKLVKAVGEQRDAVMQAIGWLAREDKLIFEDNGRKRMIGLRPQ
ncbi:MAG: winged helix-turn-helix domain-containing protein [Thermoguttaceae bacterium]